MSRTPRLTKRFSKPALSRLINGDIEHPDQVQTPQTTRLDHYLVENHPEYNRATLQKFIKDGSVTVDGTTICKPNHRLRGNELVQLHVRAKVGDPERAVSGGRREGDPIEGLPRNGEGDYGQDPKHPDDEPTFAPNSEDLTKCCNFDSACRSGSDKKEVLHILPQPTVIYEDGNVLVLDKPAGMLSMSKGNYNPEPTIENHGLLVHRLDRLTSGVIIVAKNTAAQTSLRKQFQQRKVHKTYHAIVSGTPEPAHAIISIPLARDLARPSTFHPDPEGRPAITEYKLIKTNGKYSLLELHPTTGRTHQLRIHLAHIGHPILGDPVYGDTPAPRMYLHATALEITLPGGARRTFESPLPKEFADVLRRP